MLIRNVTRVFGFLSVTLIVLAAQAQDARVVVRKPGATKSVLDLSGLKAGEGKAAELFVKTLENDLTRSGWFLLTRQGKGSYLVAGTCREAGGGLNVRCEARSNAGAELLNRPYDGTAGEAAALAHRVADDIVWAIKKVPGIASTRIAMVGKRHGKPNLYICDADGGNLKQVTKDNVVCRSPHWNRDGQTLAYTAFLNRYADVYTINLATRDRTSVASYPGSNLSPAFSPDGRNLALVVSKDGNPELYVMRLSDRRLARITRTAHATESSPSWSSDGARIVFVSDKSSSPQLYVVGQDGGEPARLNLRGSENVSPDWGADGRITYVSRREGRYQICVYDPADQSTNQVSTEYVDHEDPSWAPDGRHIVCTRISNYRPDVVILDTLGDPPVRLTQVEGEWYSPDWSSNSRALE